MKIAERDRKIIWHPYTQMQTHGLPIAIVKGREIYLFDEDGKKYIDAISSWWVNLHGHSHPYIAEKIYKQSKILEHVMFAGFTHLAAIELAERLLKILPENQSKIFYSDNGSTAVEVALKMSFQFWKNKKESKTKIIAFRNAYHGDTFGAMSVSGRNAFTQPFSSLLFDVIFIDVPLKGKERLAIQQMKKAIRQNKNNIAAFIFEPLVQGAGGMIMYGKNALDELIKICQKNSIITIADEVMTGFGRTGKMFASDYLENLPDVFCMSKGLTGGTMALGITSCKQEIFDAFLSDDKTKTFFHGHSYTANPLACTAAIASLYLLEKKSCQKQIQKITGCHNDFKEIISKNSKVREVRNTGTILAIELNTSLSNTYFDSIRDQAYSFFIQKGILIRPLGNVLYLMPPYCISRNDLKYIYKTIEEFIKEI